MLRVLCVLSAVLATSLACSDLDVLVVKAQWSKAEGHGNDRGNFITAVFQKLFDKKPAAKAFFEHVNSDNIFSPQFRAQAFRVFGGLDKVISFLDDEGALTADLAHLKGQHDSRNIAPEFFDAFAESLLETIPENIGWCFNKGAWNRCIATVIAGMQ